MRANDIVIVGAGPYGLSAAAHLRAIRGLEVRVFGEPMSFWELHMPRGMLLRSPWAGSHISDPISELTLDAYQSASDNHLSAPIPIQRFIEYGHWFQRQAAPDVDRRQVTDIRAEAESFRLTLEDGQTVNARRVVIAAGIGPFARRPEPFRGLPSPLVSHTSEHRDLERFAGKQVIVVGSGQSALESAALLHQAGAEVEVVGRAPVVRWLHQRPWMHTWPIEPLLYAPPDVGPAIVSHLVARPKWFRGLPREWQDRLTSRSLRPGGAQWVRPRLKGVEILTGRSVVSAAATGERIRLRLSDGGERCADHVLLGTGYRVDISRYSFLGGDLLASIRQVNGYPQLDAGFETSVPGLHFLGAPAAWSFGPLMWFVAGTDFASRMLRQRLARTASRSH